MRGGITMQYQIICLKNRSFWNKILFFIAFFVVAVYCISLVMPKVEHEVSNESSLYQQIEQQFDEESENKTE